MKYIFLLNQFSLEEKTFAFKKQIKKVCKEKGLDYVNQINTLKENIDTLKKSFDENISKMTEMQT